MRTATSARVRITAIGLLIVGILLVSALYGCGAAEDAEGQRILADAAAEADAADAILRSLLTEKGIEVPAEVAERREA